jgi:autotransporter-associated beta strand protein
MNGFTVVGGATFRLSGGTVDAQFAAGSVFTAGHTTGGSGNFIQDGGIFDAGGREILNAYGATGTATINGGTFICGAFRVGQATGTLNLNGGTLRANNLSHGGGTTTVNFNGGTLQAKTNATIFVPTTLTNTVIRAGGAVIDSNGFNVTIAHALTEDGGSPGGGLTKNGTGILDLTGVNTYTGVTTINAGTVSIASLEDGGVAGNLGAATSDAANIVFGGGALQFSAATAASSNRGFTINAASSATFNVSNVAGALTMTATVPTTTGFLYKIGVGEMTLDPGSSASMSLGALSANGGRLILKSGTINTTGEDPAVAAYDLGAGARGGTLRIDGATLNVGGGKSLKPGANGNGNLDILSGEVTAPSVVIGHNGIVVATQSGGNVTTTNLYHQDAGAGSSYTLTDGTLTAQRIYNNTAGAHDFTLNLNGGTLKSASGTTNLIDNQNAGTQIAVLLGDGNTIIDTTASNATIVRPMGDMPSVAGTFTKGGDNTLTLTGANTYTGATSVTAGTLALVGGSQTSPITVDSGAALGFTLGSATTSTSTVTFSGATAKVTVTGTPVAATLMTASSITGTPVLDPAIPGFELAIEGSGTLLNLKATSGGPFDTWATTTNGLSGGDAAATADPDNDGLDNAVEFVIGGQPNPANPNSDSSALAPTISTDVNNLIFTYRRTDLALTQPGIGIAAQYGSDLVGWTTATNGVDGVVIVVTDEIEAGVDQVQVSIPKTLATGAKMFARLNVVIP